MDFFAEPMAFSAVIWLPLHYHHWLDKFKGILTDLKFTRLRNTFGWAAVVDSLKQLTKKIICHKSHLVEFQTVVPMTP